jgi:chemotaxis protein MotB
MRVGSKILPGPALLTPLATLLMVIIFVLMVFVLIQVNLAYRVSGQDATLGEMRQQLAVAWRAVEY